MDGFFKFKIVDQSIGKFPLSLVWISGLNIFLENNFNGPGGYPVYEHFSSRLSYLHQLLISRKFSRSISLQIAPTLVHFNLVEKLSDKNDMFSVPISAKWNFYKKWCLLAEYGLRVSPYVREKSTYHSVFSCGFGIETSGHIFQILTSNSYAINEAMALPYTSTAFKANGIRFGFNITRLF